MNLTKIRRRSLGFRIVLAILAHSTLCASAGWSDEVDAKDYIVFRGRDTITFSQMIEQLSKADVVFIGEQHDHKLGHSLELDILKGLFAKRPSMALSLEMFERDTQIVLDEYLADQISQPSFLAASRPWPNYKTDYAPMIEFCKEKKLHVIAANAPRRYVSTTSRKGQKVLLDLPNESRLYLARLPYSMELPPGYDKALNEVFNDHGAAGSSQAGAPAMPAQPFIKEGQGLWDATMADSILKGRRTHRAKLVLQVNGSMHSDNGYGIVDRLRKSAPKLKVMTISIRPDKDFPKVDLVKYDQLADFVVLTQEVVGK
jgi:uncharacterized iron-regulated protein